MPPDVKDETTKVVQEKPTDDSTDEIKDDVTEETDEVDGGDVDIDDMEVDDTDVEDAEDRVQLFLDKYGYDSLDELSEDFEDLASLKGKIGERDLEKLIEDAEYLAKVKEFWAEQDEAKKRDAETSDETIERLEGVIKGLKKDLTDRDKKAAAKQKEVQQAKQAERVLKSFNATVIDEISKIKDLPKEDISFLKEYLGVDNPANEINIASKLETRKMAKSGIKKLLDYKQAVIKQYLDGKLKTPKITPSDDTPVTDEKQPKNLKEARKSLFEMFGVKR